MHRLSRAVRLVTAIHFAVGFWVATSVPGPLLSADDVAYLSLGRALAGEGPSPIGAQPPYGLLYPLLLAPGWLVGLGEPAMLVFARLLNAALGAALVPVLYLLVRRLLSEGRRWALVAATVGSVLPAGFLTGSIAWTERLLPLLVAMSLLALTIVWRDRLPRAAWATAALAVAQVAAHPRMALPAAVIVAWLAALLWLDHQRQLAAKVAATSAAAVLAVEGARRLVHRYAFGDDAVYFVDDLAERRGFDEVSEMVVHGLGTMGYLVAAASGLVVLGVLQLWRAGSVGRATLSVLAATVVTAGWFLTGVERADAWYHGRYVEVAVPVLLAVGVIGARRLPWFVAVPTLVAGPVLAGIVGAWAGPGATWSRGRSPVMMLGVEVSGAPFGGEVFQPAAAASVALVTGLLLYGAIRAEWRVATALTAVLLAGVGVQSGRVTLDDLHETAPAGVVAVALEDVEIDGLAADPASIQANLLAAVAWEVGLGEVAATIGPETTHVLLPEGSAPPQGAVRVVDLPGLAIWALV